MGEHINFGTARIKFVRVSILLVLAPGLRKVSFPENGGVGSFYFYDVKQ